MDHAIKARNEKSCLSRDHNCNRWVYSPSASPTEHGLKLALYYTRGVPLKCHSNFIFGDFNVKIGLSHNKVIKIVF